MRLSTQSVLLALPLLGAAAEGPFDQYKAQFQNFMDNFGSYIPNPNKHDPVHAAEAKAGSMKMNVLTLDNWRETLYSPVKQGAATPEEWWVFITGGNKTCFGNPPGLCVFPFSPSLPANAAAVQACARGPRPPSTRRLPSLP